MSKRKAEDDVAEVDYLNWESRSNDLNNLALDLIESLLGPVVALVAKALMRHGHLTVAKILSHCKAIELAETGSSLMESEPKINVGLVKSALVQLIRHDIVAVLKGETSFKEAYICKSSRTNKPILVPNVVTYEIRPHYALFFLYHDKMVDCIKTRFNTLSACLVEDLLLYGSQSQQELFKSIALRVVYSQDETALAAAQDSMDDFVADEFEQYRVTHMNSTIEDVLNSDVAQGVIEKCKTVFEDLKAKGVIRHCDPIYDDATFKENSRIDLDGNDGGVQALTDETLLKSQKRCKLALLARDVAEDNLDPMLAPMYRVNWKYYLMSFRADSVHALFKSAGGDLVGEITKYICYHDMMSSMMKDIHSQRKDPFHLHRKSEALKFQKLSCQANVTNQLPKDMPRAKKEQEIMSKTQKLPSVFHTPKGESACVHYDKATQTVTFNFHACVKELQRSVILKQVEAETGVQGARVIRCLLENGALEEKDIADLAMLPQKNARILISKLRQLGYLQTSEHSKRPDMAPTQTLFLFHADLASMHRVVTNNVFKAILNIRLRYRSYVQVNEYLDHRFAGIEESRHESDQLYPKFHAYRIALDKLDQMLIDLSTTCALMSGLTVPFPRPNKDHF